MVLAKRAPKPTAVLPLPVPSLKERMRTDGRVVAAGSVVKSAYKPMAVFRQPLVLP